MAAAPKPGSAEDRILRQLLKRYPVTEKEIALAIPLRADVVRLAVKRLQLDGLVVVEQPGGSGPRYVALSGAGFRLLGASSSERAEARREKPPPPKPRDDHDPAFM